MLAHGVLSQSCTDNPIGEKAKKNARIEENRIQQRHIALATAQLEAEDLYFEPNFSKAASQTTSTAEGSPDSMRTDTTEGDSLFSKHTGSTKGTTATDYSAHSCGQSYTREERSSTDDAPAVSWVHKGFVAEPDEIDGVTGKHDPHQDYKQESRRDDRFAKR